MTERATQMFDPIAMEVFSNRLLAIAEEMGNAMIRSSFSTNIKERRDCSTGLFDASGRLIAQAAHVPMHLASLAGGVKAVIEGFDLGQMKPGDAFMCNDPFLAGGTHMPDITVITPVLADGAVRFFAASIGHHSDVGGRVPGSIAGGSRTIFEEGLRIPAIQLAHAGEIDEKLLYLLAHNTREPEERILDMRVQVATNLVGEKGIGELLAQMGLAAVERAIEDALAYTGRRLRNRIAELDDASSSFTTYLDDDGISDERLPIHVTVTIEGERLIVDFTGTGPQARGALNMVPSATDATVYYAIKALLDPELMPNEGMFAGIEVIAPEGTLVNPGFPAATGARSISAQKAAGAIFGAFRGLLPKERVMAAANDGLPALVFSGPWRMRDAGIYVYLETIGGGGAARFDQDGMDGIHVHVTNTSNLPAEALEHEYTLLVDEYGLVPDSGGAGRRRGGLGIVRQIRALRDGTIFSVRADSHKQAPAGAFGGLDGGLARLIRNFGTPEAQVLHSKVAHLELAAGESIRMETPGAAGFGPPAERPLELLAADIRGGKVSRAAAERDYGAERVRAALREND